MTDKQVNVQTLFGDLDAEKLKMLRDAIDEIVMYLTKSDEIKEQIKSIVDTIHEEINIPKKITKRIAKTQYNNSLETETSEFVEFESLVNAIKDVE